MKRLFVFLFLGGFSIFCSTLSAEPCVKWDQVKSDIQKHFSENKNLKLISFEKTGDAQFNTFTNHTGRYITGTNGKTVEITTQEEKCVQKAKVIFSDESKTRMTQTWSVIYAVKNGKLVYDGFTSKEEELVISEARLLPPDDELKKMIITEWNKNISGDDIELVEIKELKITFKYYSHSKQASKWLIKADMDVIRKGGLLSGNKECKVSGASFDLKKKQESDPWKLQFGSMSFKCDR